MSYWTGILAVFLFATTAHAQSYGPPTYSVGDTWSRSNGLEIKVVRADENGFEMAGFLPTCQTCIYQMDKNLTILNVVHEDGKPLDVTQHGFIPLGSDWKFLDFPLEVKKRWRITPQGWFQGAPSRYTVNFWVTAYEDVKTKAGTFKAFKIDQNWTVHTQHRPFSWNSTLWFAPEVKSSVKFTTTGGAQEWELVSYTIR